MSVLTSTGGLVVNKNNRTVDGSTYNLIAVGDSLCDPKTITGGNVFVKVAAGLLLSNRGITASYSCFSFNGFSWNLTYSDGPYNPYTLTDVSPVFMDNQRIPGLTNILIAWAGTNGMYPSLGNHSAATEYTDFQTWYSARIAAGWPAGNIMFITCLPRQDNAAFDTTRATYNADLVSFAAANGSLCADAGSDATIGANGAEDNTTYYQAGAIHLNAAGHSYLATNLVYPLIP